MSKIHNNWRVFLAEKTFQDFSQGEKDKWIELAYSELIADKAATAAGENTVNKELYDLIDVSYANIGGHVSFRNASDMPADYTDWEAIDVDNDPQPDAVIFGKGDKYSGGAADGSPEGKKAMLDKTAEFLNTHGKYGEFSDALAHIMMTRYNIPSVNDEQTVRDILKKDIEWVGANPNGKYPNHTGWYIRDLGKFGKEDKHMKILLGHPQQATALQKIEDEALAEIKDYSTGKKYFVSKFQDSVRKRNIKAKKKLIGYGNEGALSGAGPMEEQVEELDEHIVRKGSEWCLKSKKSGKNLGCYPTKAGAKKREKQVQYFKHMKESIELDEGILDWLGLTRQQEKELYSDYSQPIEDIPLWIGAFPLKHMEEVKNSNKFDVIILMADDVVDLAKRFQSQKYEEYTKEPNPFIIDRYAVKDIQSDPGGEDQKIKDAGQHALQELNAGKKVLITCAQGLNRSAAATCLTLQGLGISADDAYQAIQTSRTAKKQALEMVRAQLAKERPKKLGNQAFMLHGLPHARFLNLVGINPETISLQERIKKLIAHTLKEYYNR